MKDILKKLGLINIMNIYHLLKINWDKTSIMAPELEDKLCNLFMEIQRPYTKFCPDDRVNFLNYYYTVYKLCELLDETEFFLFLCLKIVKNGLNKMISGKNLWRIKLGVYSYYLNNFKYYYNENYLLVTLVW